MVEVFNIDPLKVVDGYIPYYMTMVSRFIIMKRKRILYMSLIAGLVTSPSIAGEIFTLTYTIYHEARGESMYGKLAVASVIYNRSMKSGKSFGYECLKPEQFSCWNGVTDKERPPIYMDGEAD